MSGKTTLFHGVIMNEPLMPAKKIKLSDMVFCQENFYSKIKVYGLENFSFSSIWFTTIFIEYRGEKYIIKNKHSHMFPSSVSVEKVDRFEMQSLSVSGEKIYSMTCKVLKDPELFMVDYKEDEVFVEINYGSDFIITYNKQEGYIEELKFGGEKVRSEIFAVELDNINKLKNI